MMIEMEMERAASLFSFRTSSSFSFASLVGFLLGSAWHGAWSLLSFLTNFVLVW